MTSSVRIAVIFVSFLAVLPIRAQPQERIVAEVAGQSLTIENLKAFANDGLYFYLYPDRAEAYQHALEDLVTNSLKRIDLFASGLAQDRTLRSRLERKVSEELVIAYGKHQYEDRYLNEETIRAEHEDMGRVVLYREILLNKPPDVSPAALDSLRATVGRIQQQLEAGVSFDTLMQRYAQHEASVQRGGAAPPITWEQTLSSPLAHLLFQLSPGEVRSFERPRHFSVARVERIEHKPVPPLDEVREQIVRALHGRHASRATRAFQNEWNALIDTTALRWNTDALEQVVAWSNTPGFFEGDYHTIIPQYLAAHADAQILTDGRGNLHLSDLPHLFDTVLTLEPSGEHETDLIQEFLLEAVRTARLGERARAMGLEDEIWKPDTPSPVLAQDFLRFYNQKRIEDQIPEPTEAALRDFYEAHKDSLFYQLARVNTEIIVRPDEDEIEALWDKVQQGVPFAEVSHRRLIRSFERTRDGEIVSRLRGEPPYLGEVAFGLEEGEVVGPVAYDDAKQGPLYAIVRATGRLEERQLAFDEVRDRVAKTFVDYHRKRITADVAADLRARYPVVIHRDVLNQVMKASL